MDTLSQEARFAHPPVRSVYLAVYFEPVEGLQVSHFSSLRERWRNDYPVTAELPPLRPRNRGGEEMAVVPVSPRAWPFPYLMWSAEDDQQNLAIQNDRFILSWSFSPDSRYPGFDSLSTTMAERFAQFEAAVEAETSEALILAGAECQYVNRIEGYSAQQMIVGIATRWSAPDIEDVGESLNATYSGLRLHTCTDEGMEGCSVNLSLDVDDDGTFLAIESERDLLSDESNLRLAGLDVAHRQLIRKFVEFTSVEMHEAWGRMS
ncbi:TIGR04255 family protein [Mumia sp. zg.B17]|uniref:TIGR04255 family protein n=1 Tax=Mumia sp. zg.B17 TaxID=2855446 RepID=UPI001C6DFC63|nr:TIGR04255 family protein [Mumia sp. zg.B17]MBW9207517.1 TIGR04255 family protein [Mumia sp. zg.B17]